MIGTTLSHFKITAKLGEGGMGEVYRADDTRLGREVAIKVLPEAVAGDPERLARFEREAKMLAALNHPHIAGIYSLESATVVEDARPVSFLVMELAEGQDLAQRIARGPLPIDEALPIAHQVAEALEAAHESGIVHRDLKPANIKVTSDGRVKVLDFGLAKALASPERGSSPHAPSMSPTLTAQMTGAGVILGTAAYMSPEQAKGLEADRRSDVWAFGVVLWEMLTGRQLFQGDSVSDTLAAVLRDDLDADSLPADTPPTVRMLLARCLDRDPKSRLRDIGEARIALDASSTASGASTLLSSTAVAPVPGGAPRARPFLPWLVAAAMALAALALGLRLLTIDEPIAERVHSALLPPEGQAFDLGSGMALSPDGRTVAFVALDEFGFRQLWVRGLESSVTLHLDGTEGVMYPFWSPDGRHIAFFSENFLKRMPAKGGPSQSIAPVAEARGGAWSQNGDIVYAPDFRGGLRLVAAGGGESTELTEVDSERGESSHRFPVFLPDGDHVLFLSQTAEGGSQRDDSRIELVSIRTRERSPVVSANSSIAYSETGHLLFWHGGSLMAAEFDDRRRVLTGDPVPIAERIAYTGNEFGTFSSSRLGTLVYQTGSQSGAQTRLETVDLAGQRLAEPSVADFHRELSLSHDGKRAAYRSTDYRTLWIRDLTRGNALRFTFEDGDHFSPIWSPDDKWLLYVTDRAGPFQAFRKLSSGAGTEELIVESEHPLVAWDWSPDGERIAFEVRNPDTDQDIAVYSIPDETLEILVQTPLSETEPRFSPDGKWLAYFSTETGDFQVYLISLQGIGGKYQISTKGGLHPEWDPRGGRLYYYSLNAEVMAVDLALGESVEIGLPRSLFRLRFPVNSEYPFRVRPDGESFVINQMIQQLTSEHMTLVQNWTSLLDRD